MYLKHHFVPDTKYVFATQTLQKDGGKKKALTFQHSWLQRYKWLVYSPSQKGGFCKYCVLFPPASSCIKTGVLVSQPMQKFNKATGKGGYLETHDQLSYHRDAVVRSLSLCHNMEQPESSLPYKISTMNKEMYEKNYSILKNVVRSVIFCGKQNVPLRGHRDNSTSTAPNKGNFLALLQLMSENDVVLKEHLEQGKKNARCTSKTIQNEIISIIGDYIRGQTTKSLQDSKNTFSIIADEVTGEHDNREVLSICFRYVDAEKINEVFFDFVELTRTTGAHIAAAILNSLQQNNIDVKMCRGQSYDGASAMSSERIGVQANIKAASPLALYTHCKSHILNLSIASACKIAQIKNMMDIVNEVFKFFSQFPKTTTIF